MGHDPHGLQQRFPACNRANAGLFVSWVKFSHEFPRNFDRLQLDMAGKRWYNILCFGGKNAEIGYSLRPKILKRRKIRLLYLDWRSLFYELQLPEYPEVDRGTAQVQL